MKKIRGNRKLDCMLFLAGLHVGTAFLRAGVSLEGRPLPEFHWLSTKENKKEKLVLNSPGSQLEGFAVCGPERKWVWAKAIIDGASVLVEAPEVPRPPAVRYGWAKNPTCNLYKGEGLPAASFRTDAFEAVTVSRKY